MCFCIQVLLAEFKTTGTLYAIKALKKREIVTRDEVDRSVIAPWKMHGTRKWTEVIAKCSFGVIVSQSNEREEDLRDESPLSGESVWLLPDQ